jgi:sodium/proline symporter
MDDFMLSRCSWFWFFGIAYFHQHPELAGLLANPETVFMELTKILFNPWVVGVILAAILSAVMSTLSCQFWYVQAH